MGLVMALGPQIGKLGPSGAVQMCRSAVTRFRQYTCVHSLGHAYMRLFDERLSFGLHACRALGPADAPDCAQGAFHDYWLSLSGGDGTTNLPGRTRSAARPVRPAAGVVRRARAGSAISSRSAQEDPGQRTCGRRPLSRSRRAAALGLHLSRLVDLHSRPVRAGPDLCGAPAGRRRQLPARRRRPEPGLERPPEAGRADPNVQPPAAGGPRGCSTWFGKTLSVVTNGRFTRAAAPSSIRPPTARPARPGDAHARPARHVLVKHARPRRLKPSGEADGELEPPTPSLRVMCSTS